LSAFGSCVQVRSPEPFALHFSSVQATPSSAQSVAAQHSPHVALFPSVLLQHFSLLSHGGDGTHTRSLPQTLGLHGSSCGHCESPQHSPQPMPAQQLPPLGQSGCVHR
jgi:hypothetical protein